MPPEKLEVSSLLPHGDTGRAGEGRSQPCWLHSPGSSPARNRKVNKTQDEGLPGDSSWLPLKFTKAALLMPQRLLPWLPVNYYTAGFQDILSAMPWELE